MTNEAIVGIDLGGTQVRVGKVRAGEVERREASRISGRERAEVVLGEIFQAIDPVFYGDVVGIGGGVPHELGFELGYAVMVVLYAYDPELIVMGGSISRAFPLFEKGMRERLGEYAYQHALERVRIEPSEIEHAAILGAAALYLDQMDR